MLFAMLAITGRSPLSHFCGEKEMQERYYLTRSKGILVFALCFAASDIRTGLDSQKLKLPLEAMNQGGQTARLQMSPLSLGNKWSNLKTSGELPTVLVI
jgi:hypothetical protein